MKYVSFIFLSVLLSGCQPAGIKRGNEAVAGQVASNKTICVFDAIDSPVFRLAPMFKPYVTNSFYYDPDREAVWQLDQAMYFALKVNPFKVVSSSVLTAQDASLRKSNLSSYRYEELMIDGKPFVRDKAFSTKVITADCHIYYLNGSTSSMSLLKSVVSETGESISSQDLKVLYGDKALEAFSFNPSVKYDKFTKLYDVAIPYYKNNILRAGVSEVDGVVAFIQLYVDLTFFDKWGSVDVAFDENGESYDVTKISSDVDCSHSDIAGCKLTETVGINVSEEFIKNNKDGFSIKFSGRKQVVVDVLAAQLDGLVLGIERARNIKEEVLTQ